jgi:hypothetical protein
MRDIEIRQLRRLKGFRMDASDGCAALPRYTKVLTRRGVTGKLFDIGHLADASKKE